MTDDLPPDCAKYLEVLNAALDERQVPASAHVEACATCRTATEAFAVTERVDVSFGFADRVVRAAVRDRSRRRRLTWTSRGLAGALAASLLVGGFLFSRPRSAPEVATVPPPAPLAPQLRDAGTAFVSLTVKTTDETLAPAKTLFVPPSVEKAAPATPDRVSTIPESAKAGLEPFANTARRAVNLFVRDVGGAAGVGKGKS